MSKTILTEGDDGVQLIINEPDSAENVSQRWPIHVVYGGVDRFAKDTTDKFGRLALRNVDEYAPNFVEFAAAMKLPGSASLPSDKQAITELENSFSANFEHAAARSPSAAFAWKVYHRTLEKLAAEPVEDLRIDFEDGYGFRSNDEEDGHAVSSAKILAQNFLDGTITAFSGFRIKSFGPETSARAERTLEIFLTTLLAETGGRLPANFVVTLPKVTDRDQVKHLRRKLEQIEAEHSLADGSIGVELLIETPTAMFDHKGRVPIRSFIKAARGRCTSLHFGAYDYTASLGISARFQDLRHPACDLARQFMLIAAAAEGIRVSDSVTTQMPLPIYRGDDLSDEQIAENRRAVHAGWQRHFANVSNSRANGFYQSWDLHPNQLPARYAAVFAFFLDGAALQAERLKGFIERSTRASLTGTVFDDAASAQGILTFFKLALNCGAMKPSEVEAAVGLTAEEIVRGSFQEIMSTRLA